jgi:hypothetical protein
MRVAYLSLCDEVLLYFIVRVEVVAIQIWFEFKLVWNLQNRFEKDKWFPIFPSLLGRNWLGPAGLLLPHEAYAAQPAGATAKRTTGEDLRSIGNLTR